ncbi:MAG: hypothetical protein V1841_01420 [Patescibacteria group bacterium]
MPTYWIHYKWMKDGKDDGEGKENFDASSDEEAMKKSQRIMQDFRINPAEPGLRYVYLRTVREIG